MPEMTITEQCLVRIWQREASDDRNWYFLFDKLTEIATVLASNGCHDGAELFDGAAVIALRHQIDKIRSAA